MLPARLRTHYTQKDISIGKNSQECGASFNLYGTYLAKLFSFGKSLFFDVLKRFFLEIINSFIEICYERLDQRKYKIQIIQ